MKKDLLTDEQVEIEIEKLKQSEDVKLAKAEQRMKYARRQYLYTLRFLEKRGKELKNLGMTVEDFKKQEKDYSN